MIMASRRGLRFFPFACLVLDLACAQLSNNPSLPSQIPPQPPHSQFGAFPDQPPGRQSTTTLSPLNPSTYSTLRQIDSTTSLPPGFFPPLFPAQGSRINPNQQSFLGPQTSSVLPGQPGNFPGNNFPNNFDQQGFRNNQDQDFGDGINQQPGAINRTRGQDTFGNPPGSVNNFGQDRFNPNRQQPNSFGSTNRFNNNNFGSDRPYDPNAFQTSSERYNNRDFFGNNNNNNGGFPGSSSTSERNLFGTSSTDRPRFPANGGRFDLPGSQNYPQQPPFGAGAGRYYPTPGSGLDENVYRNLDVAVPEPFNEDNEKPEPKTLRGKDGELVEVAGYQNGRPFYPYYNSAESVIATLPVSILTLALALALSQRKSG